MKDPIDQFMAETGVTLGSHNKDIYILWLEERKVESDQLIWLCKTSFEFIVEPAECEMMLRKIQQMANNIAPNKEIEKNYE